MQSTGVITDLSLDITTKKAKISLVLDTNEIDVVEQLKNENKLNVELKKYRQKRSLDANGYMWVLIREISKKINVEPKEIYREAISHMNTYDVLPLKDEVVDRFIENWKSNGDGWICEKIPSKLDGFTNIRAYYGSSTFNTKEMSELIDSVIGECKNLGIETRSKSEVDSLLRSWK